jgi:Fic family protein
MEKLYEIEKPDLSEDPIKLSRLLADPAAFKAIEKTEFPEYLHWKDIKYKNWIPESIKSKKDFWAAVKFFRKVRQTQTQIKDSSQRNFTWIKLNHYERMTHEIDIDMSKYLLNFPNMNEGERQKYQMQGIIEEAIASSQLEGAHTTRKVAKKMIQEKRKPRNDAERMIFNNYQTMKAIQERYKDEKLSLDVLFELHRMLTQETSLDHSEQGNFRKPEDKIVVQKGDDPTVISYVTPPIDFVKSEMQSFIDFANDEQEDGEFVHPLIKAIMLHFWMGLLHPFVDGNGRLARGLFYWYLLRKGYWAFAFLPISIAIKSAPAQYSEAYVLSEQDDNDLTYFIDYHIRRINVAVANFKTYIQQKASEYQNIDRILQSQNDLNRRQIELLVEYKKSPEQIVNLTSYLGRFNVTKATAISDLKGLQQQGYLTATRRGRNVFYNPTPKVSSLTR